MLPVGTIYLALSVPPHLAPMFAARLLGQPTTWRAAQTANEEPRLIGAAHLSPETFHALVMWVASGLAVPPPSATPDAIPFLVQFAPVFADRTGVFLLAAEQLSLTMLSDLLAAAHLTLK